MRINHSELTRWVWHFVGQMMMILMILSFGSSLAVRQPVLAAEGQVDLASTIHSPTILAPALPDPLDGSHQVDFPPSNKQPTQPIVPSGTTAAQLKPPAEPAGNYGAAPFITQPANYPVVDAALFTAPPAWRTGLAPVAVGSISGHVYETGSNAPVANANIYVNTNDQNYSYGNAQTNALGYFQVTGLEPRSDYKIQVWSVGYLRTFYPAIALWNNAANIQVLSGQDTPNTDIHVIKADFYITGRVTNSDTSPAVYVWMEAFHQDGWFVGINANSNGEYSIPVIGGTWQVFPYQPPYSAPSIYVPISTGQTVANINFTLIQTGNVSGTVAAEGSGLPLANITIVVERTSDRNWVSVVCTGTDGSYQAQGILPGEYKVWAETRKNRPFSGSGYSREYWQEKTSWDTANPIQISSGSNIQAINFSLSPNGSISGTVRDGQGNPLANMAVSLDGPGFGASTCTNASGQYNFSADFNVDWRVRAAPEGTNWCGGSNAYAHQYWQNVLGWNQATTIKLTPQAPNRTGIDFSLQPGGGISGHVYRADGVTPVEYTCINISSSALNWNQIGGWGWTGSDGSFSIYGIPLGLVYIRTDVNCSGTHQPFTDEWYAVGGSTPDSSQASPVTITAGQLQTGVNFQLDPTGTISGTVRDGQGNPLANIPISLDGPGFGDSICTNTSGQYSFNASFNVDWRVHAAPEGTNWCGNSNAYAQQYWQATNVWYNATLIRLTPQASDRSGIDFSLQPGGGISGHVYQGDGVTPVQGACINISGGAPNWYQIAGWGRSGADGFFSFFGVPVGPVYIYTDAQCGGLNRNLINEWYASAGSNPDRAKASTVTIQAGQLVGGVNFQLDAGGSIAGHVYQQNGGGPIAQAQIYALAASNYSTVQSTSSGEDGSYQLPGLPAGAYYVAVFADGYGGVYYINGYDDPHAQIVNVSAPLTTPGIDFHLLPEATISGKVFQIDGITAISGASVYAWPLHGGMNRHAVSAADGLFTIHELSSGDYVAYASASGYESEYYLNSFAWFAANSISVSQPNVTPGINFTLTALPATLPSSEQAALVALYQATDGPNWANRTGWLSHPNPCTWWAVFCHGGHVVRLNLDNNHLTGQLPDQLVDLSELEYLSLRMNSLEGSIPIALGSLTHIRWLYLDGNQFSGDLPASLSDLTGILPKGADTIVTQSLMLGYNRLNVPTPYPSSPPTALEQFLLARDPEWQLTQSISAAIPTSGGSLTSRDSRTTASFPPDSTRPETCFLLIPQIAPMETTGSLRFAQNSFQLVALDAGGHPLASFTFNTPITLTLHYANSDISEISEGQLKLYYWDKAGSAWADAATTCSPASTYTRDLAANTLSLAVCHLSEFTLLGPSRAIYVPVIRR